MTTPESSMNNVLRGRGPGRQVPTGQANTDAPADPITQAREIARELAGQIDTLNRLLAKAAAANKNPFASKEG